MKIFAHRGNGLGFPENTWGALTTEQLKDLDGVETDVQLTKDNILVIHHDEKLGRIFEGNEPIRKLTFAQLQERKCLVKGFEDQKIPTLESYLNFALEHEIFIHLEIKAYDYWHFQKLAKKTVQAVEQAKMQNLVSYSCFFYPVLLKIKSINKNYPCNWLVERKLRKLDFPFLKHMDGLHLDIHIWKKLSNEERNTMLDIRSVRIWTVKTQEQAQELLSSDIEALIANNPLEILAMNKG